MPGVEQKDRLIALLEEQLAQRPEDLAKARELLAPFYERAESGQYPLAAENGLKPDEVADALRRATGATVTRVIFVSHANPVPKPEWMTQKVYETRFRTSLEVIVGNNWDSFGITLGARLWYSFEASLRARTDLGTILRNNFKTSNLGASFRNSLKAIFGISIGGRIWDSVMASLFYFLGFTIMVEREEASRLEPLVRLLPKCIPLGEKQDEPGAWIVLCA